MSLILIDYTPFYYSFIAHAPAPAVVRGKFVQIRHEDSLFLVLSPKEFTKYHANIVERFCMDKGIEGTYTAKRDAFLISDSAWKVLGGGKFERNADRKTIRFYDDSMAYGKFHAIGLRESLAALPDFSSYAIDIE